MRRTQGTHPFHDVRGGDLPELAVVSEDVEVGLVVPLVCVRRRAKVQLLRGLRGNVQSDLEL